MYQRMSKHYFWLDMKKDIKEYATQCEQCNMHSNPFRIGLKNKKSRKPFGRVAMDVIGPFPATPEGNRYIAIFVHYCTHFPNGSSSGRC